MHEVVLLLRRRPSYAITEEYRTVHSLCLHDGDLRYVQQIKQTLGLHLYISPPHPFSRDSAYHGVKRPDNHTSIGIMAYTVWTWHEWPHGLGYLRIRLKYTVLEKVL